MENVYFSLYVSCEFVRDNWMKAVYLFYTVWSGLKGSESNGQIGGCFD